MTMINGKGCGKMKVKDLFDAIYEAKCVIGQLEQEPEKNEYKISRIENLIKVLGEADITISYGSGTK